MALEIEKKHLKIIKDILSKYPYSFYAFGSRVTGKAKQYSDLDLCFKDNIKDLELFNIREDFEESDLPYTVDLINWNTISDDFKKNIKEYLIDLNDPQCN